MPELGRFQDAFARALAGEFAALARWADAEAEPRFAVHRNTVARGLAEALAAQFPTVAKVLGPEAMRAAALAFAADHPPASPSLMAYGAGFPDWLAGFPPAADLPHLPGLARLDWGRRDALFAADAAAQGADAFAVLAPEAWATTVAELHPSARLFWFHDGTPGLWSALQAETPPAEVELSSEPQGLLLLRPQGLVVHRILAAGEHAFLAACRRGESLAVAAEAALTAEPGLALAGAFADLIAIGAFGRILARRGSVS